MNAIVIAADRSLHWTAVPDPVPAADEVLVDIHATAVNRADLLQRAGKYPPPPGAPEWMGLEMAGVVAHVGPAAGSRWRPGDRVCGLLGGGGYAERVAVRPELLLPVPAGMTMAQAASLPEVFATVYLNLVLEAGLAAGETVLIQAGASGIGIAGIQFAKFLGARVITTVGSPDKAQAIRPLGPDVVVDRTTTDLGAVLDACEAEGRPVNVVLDCVGGPDLGRHFGKLARGGRWVLIATLGGETTQIDLRLVLTRGLRLIGSTLRSRPVATKARVIAGLAERVWPAFADGRMRPVIHRVLPIQQAEDAHAILERRENIGKVVLETPRGQQTR